MFLCFDYMIQASWKTVGHKCMLKKVQGVASRACCKCLKQVESVASRACWKLLQKVESVASRVGCTQNNNPSDDVTWSVRMNFTTILLTYRDPCKLTWSIEYHLCACLLNALTGCATGTWTLLTPLPGHPTPPHRSMKTAKMPQNASNFLGVQFQWSATEYTSPYPHKPVSQLLVKSRGCHRIIPTMVYPHSRRVPG